MKMLFSTGICEGLLKKQKAKNVTSNSPDPKAKENSLASQRQTQTSVSSSYGISHLTTEI